MRYRADIDGLRAIAVGAVVIEHAGLGLPGGFAGVDVFFVISGFLITGILRDEIDAGRFSLSGFYERRIRRIFPALFVMLAATTLAAWVWLLPERLRDYDLSLRGAVLFASNIVFSWDTGYFDSDAATKPLLHTWSLAVEEQFYLVFPPLLWLASRVRRARIAVMGVLTLASFAAAAALVPMDPETGFFMPHLRAWELFAGALLALGALPAPRARGWREAAGAAGLLMMGTTFLIFDQTNAGFPGPRTALPVAGAALVIWAGLGRAGGGGSLAGRLLSTAPFTGLGKISYSLYLWHWPFFVFWRIATGGEPGAPEALGLIAASVLVSWASWRFVETPFRRPAAASPRARLFAGAAGVSLAMMAASVVGDWTDGLPQRYPPEVQRVLAAKRAWTKSVGRRCIFGASGRFEGIETAEELAAKACRAGPEGPARLVVWGDSHAAALQPALMAWAEETGTPVLFLTHSGCPPVPGYRMGDTRRGRSCTRFNTLVAEALTAHPPPEVLLIARWTFYFDPAETWGFGARAEAAAAALRENVAALRAAGVRVAMLGPIPTHPADVPEAIARGLLRDQGPGEGMPRAVADAAVDPVLALLAAAGPDVLPDARDVICDPAWCRIADAEGLPLYGDTSHLTPDGSKLFLPVFRATLTPAP